MKIYPYIIIDKSNMKVLEHRATAERAADIMYLSQNSIPDRFIVVKNEKEMIDLSQLKHFTALPIDFYHKLLDIL